MSSARNSYKTFWFEFHSRIVSRSSSITSKKHTNIVNHIIVSHHGIRIHKNPVLGRYILFIVCPQALPKIFLYFVLDGYHHFCHPFPSHELLFVTLAIGELHHSLQTFSNLSVAPFVMRNVFISVPDAFPHRSTLATRLPSSFCFPSIALPF